MLGVAGATPVLDVDLTPAALAALGAQGTRAARELRSRLSTEPWQPEAANPAASVRQGRARIAALLGWQLPVLLPVALPEGQPWTDGLAGRGPAGAEPAALRDWLGKYARVRRPVAAALDAFGVAEALGLGAKLTPVAVQLLASGAADGWHANSPTPPSGLTHVVVCSQLYDSPRVAVSGLFVDGWTQRTPGTSQNTGVAFHFDDPDSTPPQTALVAVAPDLSSGRQPADWDLGTLLDLLWSTLRLAEQRAAAAESVTPSGITVGALP